MYSFSEWRELLQILLFFAGAECGVFMLLRFFRAGEKRGFTLLFRLLAAFYVTAAIVWGASELIGYRKDFLGLPVGWYLPDGRRVMLLLAMLLALIMACVLLWKKGTGRVQKGMLAAVSLLTAGLMAADLVTALAAPKYGALVPVPAFLTLLAVLCSVKEEALPVKLSKWLAPVLALAQLVYAGVWFGVKGFHSWAVWAYVLVPFLVFLFWFAGQRLYAKGQRS